MGIKVWAVIQLCIVMGLDYRSVQGIFFEDSLRVRQEKTWLKLQNTMICYFPLEKLGFRDLEDR